MKDDFTSTEGETFAVTNAGSFSIAEEEPWRIHFSWKETSITVALVNGEDVLKLAGLFAKMLDRAGIEHKTNE